MLRPSLQLRQGERAIVHSFEDEKIASKLMTMGMLPGSVIEYVRKAPFGGAIYMKVDGYNLALRNNEAAAIVVE
jgi:ferrous iron transport protein A